MYSQNLFSSFTSSYQMATKTTGSWLRNPSQAMRHTERNQGTLGDCAHCCNQLQESKRQVQPTQRQPRDTKSKFWDSRNTDDEHGHYSIPVFTAKLQLQLQTRYSTHSSIKKTPAQVSQTPPGPTLHSLRCKKTSENPRKKTRKYPTHNIWKDNSYPSCHHNFLCSPRPCSQKWTKISGSWRRTLISWAYQETHDSTRV